MPGRAACREVVTLVRCGPVIREIRVVAHCAVGSDVDPCSLARPISSGSTLPSPDLSTVSAVLPIAPDIRRATLTEYHTRSSRLQAIEIEKHETEQLTCKAHGKYSVTDARIV